MQKDCKWFYRFFVVFHLLSILACSVKSEIKNSIFYNGVILSTESWNVVSVINFYKHSYDILTTDNSHGQMDKKVTEAGSFKVREDTLILMPYVRLICPELIKEWQSIGQVVYTDVTRTDSIVIQGFKICSSFAEYKYVNRDTLSDELINKLGFQAKKYFVSKDDEQIILTGEPSTLTFRKWVIH